MARIRTIKPEFPQSESMGNVSRDARLTFIQLWTLADDSGRLRGNSRMLASLLFPYDNDAPALINGWLSELEKESCLIRYSADGASYIQVCNWLNHQKIDKPSESKIPPFDESSRILANPRESSPLDQGSRIKDQGKEATAKSARSAIHFKTFLENCKAKGEKPISGYKPVFDYALQAGLSDELVGLCWNEFYRRFAPGGISDTKKYADWRKAFRNCVEGNWYKLWWLNPGTSQYELTTAGRTADKVAA